MATPFDQEFNPEFMGLLAQAGPVPDVMPNPMPAMAPDAGLLAQAPAAVTAPSAPTVSPEMQMLERLLSGGSIGKGMSLGDKLTTLGAVLSSAAYGGNPAEVMQNARAQRIADIQSRMQLAQMRTQAEQRQKQQAFINQYSQSLPEDKRGILQNMSVEEAFKTVSQEAFRPKQVFQTKRDSDSGNMRIIFGDGSSQVTDIKMPANTEDRDIGGAIQVVDKDTGQVLQTIPKTMNPYQAANYNLARNREARIASQPRGGDGSGGREAKDIWITGANGKPTKVRGISVGGNRYQVGGRVVEAVPSPERSGSGPRITLNPLTGKFEIQ